MQNEPRCPCSVGCCNHPVEMHRMILSEKVGNTRNARTACIGCRLRIKLDTLAQRERWRLIKQASAEVDGWDELRKAEAYRRTTK